MVLAKYSPEGLEAVRNDGYVTREASAARVAASLGGSLEAMYFFGSGDWTHVGIMELPSVDDGFALASMFNTVSTHERIEIRELRTGAEADAAIAAQIDWTRPGQG